MKKVQEGDLIVLFSKHKKHCVHKVGEFRNNEHEAQIDHQRFLWIVYVWLVLCAVPSIKAPVGYPQTNHGTDSIDTDQNRIVMQNPESQVVWRSVFHDRRADHRTEEHIGQRNGHHNPWSSRH